MMKKTMVFLIVLMGMGALAAIIDSEIPIDLIANGDFSTGDCIKQTCVFIAPDTFTNWIPYTNFKISKGSRINDFLGDERVLVLTPQTYTCVNQVIENVQPGLYELNVVCGAIKESDFSNQLEFIVIMNNKLLSSFFLTDLKANSKTISVSFELASNANLNLCAYKQKKQLYFGVFIKSVSLVMKQSVPLQPHQVADQSIINIPIIDLSTKIPSDLPLNSQKFFVESYSGQCYSQQLDFLTNQQVMIYFKYFSLTDKKTKKTDFVITLGDKQVIRYNKQKSSKTLNYQLNFAFPKGSYLLKFCPFKSQNDPPHYFKISGVKTSHNECREGWSKNLILNGRFNQPTCSQTSCYFNVDNFEPQNVIGWIPSPKITFGKGNFYNSNWGISEVSVLDAQSNTCIKQKMALVPGKVRIKFQFAGIKKDDSYETSRFELKINDQNNFKQTFMPINDKVTDKEITFDLGGFTDDPELKFCGKGTSDGFGAAVSNIELAYWDQCLQTLEIDKF